MTSTFGSYRVGPVNCPLCHLQVARLFDLIPHFTTAHPELSVRDRSLLKDQARFEAGWFPKDEKRTWDRGIRA